MNIKGIGNATQRNLIVEIRDATGPQYSSTHKALIIQADQRDPKTQSLKDCEPYTRSYRQDTPAGKEIVPKATLYTNDDAAKIMAAGDFIEMPDGGMVGTVKGNLTLVTASRSGRTMLVLNPGALMGKSDFPVTSDILEKQDAMTRDVRARAAAAREAFIQYGDVGDEFHTLRNRAFEAEMDL